MRKSGSVSLVGVLFLIGGAFNMIWGFAALGISLGGTDSEVLGDIARGDLEGLGIAGLAIGSLQLLAGVGILRRIQNARVLGLILASAAVFLNFAYHRVLEGWAFTGLVVNFAILMILTSKQEEFK